jgi:hypothetical protein
MKNHIPDTAIEAGLEHKSGWDLTAKDRRKDDLIRIAAVPRHRVSKPRLELSGRSPLETFA